MFLSSVQQQRGIIPTINIADTSLDVSKYLYLINANQKSKKSMLYFIRLIVKDRIIMLRFRKVFFKRLLLSVI